MREVKTETVHYFPDDPNNKVYAVDVYVTVCKCIKVEARNREEAEQMAALEMLRGPMSHTQNVGGDAAMIRDLSDMGFHDAEEPEYRVSGEANELGEIEYY